MTPELPVRTRWLQSGDTVIVELRSHPVAAVIGLVIGVVIDAAAGGAWTQKGLSLGIAAFMLMGLLFLLFGIVALVGHAELRREPDRLFFGTVVGGIRFGRSVSTGDIRKVELVEHLDQSSRKYLYSFILVITSGRPMKIGAGYSKQQVAFLWKIVQPGFRSSTRVELVAPSSD